MAYLAILSASHGKRAGFAAVIGIAMGLCIVGIAAALGVATAISHSLFMYQLLRWFGISYLLWLAWNGWKEAKETSTGVIKETLPQAKFFKSGLITNLLNPKAFIFYIAILPTFIAAPVHVLGQTITLTLVYVAIATAIHCFIVMLAGSANKIFEKPQEIFILRRILSLMLVAVALWFAITTGQKLE